MNLNSLKYFVTVAQYGNISKAAEKLFITQPALSRAIQRLENELGVTLLERSVNSCHLTLAGKQCLKEAKEIIYRADKMIADLHAFSLGETGAVSIGYCGNEGPFLSILMDAISQKFPNIEVLLCKDVIDNLNHALFSGKLDFIFTYHNFEHVDLRSYKVQDNHLQLIVSKKHRFAQNISVLIRELIDEPIFSWERDIDPRFYDYFVHLCISHGFTPKFAGFYRDSDALFSHILSTQAVGLIPSATQYLANPALFSFVDIELDNEEMILNQEQIIAWSQQNTNPCVGSIVKMVLPELNLSKY